MAFCKKCGNNVDADAVFCVSCGTPVGNTTGKVEQQPEQDDSFKTQLRQKPAYGAVNLDDLPKGHVINDRYEVKEKLGQGGFGTVYRAFDKKMKIDKALKVLPEAVTSDREAMESLGEEASTMVRLNHPNIVRVYDFEEKGRIKYIDMEFVDGKNLTDIKLDEPSKKMTEASVRKLVSQITAGLSYAHSKNVIHKDIKPQNILISKTGKIKIMDFGISETVRSSMSRVENSSSAGTLMYMSPEQIKGMNVGREADIYSFGIMLYELLSGKPPFHKGDISYQIINQTPEFIAGVSDEMNQFLQKCLAKDYTQRFRDFGAVQKAFDGKAIPETLSTEKKPESVNSGGKKFWKRLSVSAGILSCVIIVVMFMALGNNDKSPEPALNKTYTAAVNKARLNVNAKPPDAKIRILNIKPAFTQEISLEPGKYHISVSKNGYETKKQWVQLYEDQVKTLDVYLTRKKIIKIGVAGAHSGELAEYGLPTVNAVKLAAEEFNKKGGLLGRRIVVIAEDDVCRINVATDTATKLVTDNVVAVVGHICSGATKSALGVYKDADLVCISPSATNTDLTLSGDYPNFFRTISHDAAQAQLQVKFAIETLKVTKVAILHDKGDYGKESAMLAKQYFNESGKVEILLFEGVTAGAVDYSAIVEKVKRSGAELVVWGGYHPEASRIIKQMRNKNMETLFLGSDGIKDNTFIKTTGVFAEGVYVTAPFDSSGNPLYIAATKAHIKAYSSEPGAFYYNGYSAALALFNAIEKAGTTKYNAVAKTLRTEFIDTPIGKISFDDKGDIIGAGFAINKVRNGVFVELKKW